MRYPNLLFGIVVILSTMSLEIVPSPFWSLGWITIRKSGASLLSLVMTQIVIDLSRRNDHPERSLPVVAYRRNLYLQRPSKSHLASINPPRLHQ